MSDAPRNLNLWRGHLRPLVKHTGAALRKAPWRLRHPVLYGVLCAVIPFVVHWADAGYLLYELESRSPILERHLEEWHRRCDTHLGEPVETPVARDCARELHELAVYAQMKGFTRAADSLTAYATQIGWTWSNK